MSSSKHVRCSWAERGSELDIEYHDKEWGVPSRDDRHLFEMLVLEGAQAGLSWSTILNKRPGYQRAFAGFEAKKVARFTAARQEKLMQDPGIVRNRLKISSAVDNAKALLKVRQEFGSFADYIWGFVNHRPIQNESQSLGQLPAETGISKAMSKDLKKRGFRFVGPTICYAFMQAVGMVNDHQLNCFRYSPVAALGKDF